MKSVDILLLKTTMKHVTAFQFPYYIFSEKLENLKNGRFWMLTDGVWIFRKIQRVT